MDIIFLERESSVQVNFLSRENDKVYHRLSSGILLKYNF